MRRAESAAGASLVVLAFAVYLGSPWRTLLDPRYAVLTAEALVTTGSWDVAPYLDPDARARAPRAPRPVAFQVSEGRFGNAGKSELNQQVLQSMWPAAWRTAIGTIMSLGVSQGMSVAMANLLVAAQAASVQLALRVMEIISHFSQVPYYTRIPVLNRLRAGGRTAQLAAEAAGAMRASLWIFVAGAIMVDLGVRQLLALIGSQTQFPDKLFWLVLTLAVYAERYGAMHIQLLLTSNKAIAHVANGVTGLIWIVGMTVLFPAMGSLALAVSMLIAYAGFYAWYSAMHSNRSMPGNAFRR